MENTPVFNNRASFTVEACDIGYVVKQYGEGGRGARSWACEDLGSVINLIRNGFIITNDTPLELIPNQTPQYIKPIEPIATPRDQDKYE